MPDGPYAPWDRRRRDAARLERQRREDRRWHLLWMAFGLVVIFAIAAELTWL